MVNLIACLVAGSVIGLIGSVILNTHSTSRAYVNLVSSVVGAFIGEFVFIRLVTAQNNFWLALATIVGSAFLLFVANRVIYLIGKHNTRE